MFRDQERACGRVTSKGRAQEGCCTVLKVQVGGCSGLRGQERGCSELRVQDSDFKVDIKILMIELSLVKNSEHGHFSFIGFLVRKVQH